MKPKKAQGLPITTIIIAILGLVVLIVIMFIFTGRIGIWGGEIAKCPGACLDGCPADYATQPGSYAKDAAGTPCKDTTGKQLTCCIPVVKKGSGDSCSSGAECVSGKCGADSKCT